MKKLHINIILLSLVVIIAIVPLIMYSGLGEKESFFSGSDDVGKQVVEDAGYKPWFSSFWQPPSPEIESLLFAIQAAIGALIIGYFFGYWRGQRKYEK